MTTTLKARGTDELPIQLDGSIRNQSSRVYAALRLAIIDGLLKAEQSLPSSRALAVQIGINRNAVVAAYEQLQSDGLIEARRGSGTFVTEQLPISQPIVKKLAGPVILSPSRRAFALGHTAVDNNLLQDLARATSRIISKATPDQLSYGDPRGSLVLREAIAAFLATSRGIRCDPSCVMIVAGTQSGLRLCMETLLEPGDTVWMEDPGYYIARSTLSAIGLRIKSAPVDQEGLIIPTNRRTEKSSAVFVTPTHQFPTGVTMSMPRRVALLEWAHKTGAWIFEDDYDSEFRYAGPPLTALAGLSQERVIYCGTFTKTLFPSMRLAYLVLPSSIIARIIAARVSHDRFPPRFMQDAVADLMTKGHLARHIRRARNQYREARDCVAQTLTLEAAANLDLVIPSQGLHMVAYLPDQIGREDAALISDVARVETKLISETRLNTKGREGFILGFSGHPLHELQDAAERLGKAVRTFRKSK